SGEGAASPPERKRCERHSATRGRRPGTTLQQSCLPGLVCWKAQSLPRSLETSAIGGALPEPPRRWLGLCRAAPGCDRCRNLLAFHCESSQLQDRKMLPVAARPGTPG